MENSLELIELSNIYNVFFYICDNLKIFTFSSSALSLHVFSCCKFLLEVHVVSLHVQLAREPPELLFSVCQLKRKVPH